MKIFKKLFLFCFFLSASTCLFSGGLCKHNLQTDSKNIVSSYEIHSKNLIFENYYETGKTYTQNKNIINKLYAAVKIEPSFLIYNENYCILKIHPAASENVNFYATIKKNEVCSCGRINDNAKLTVLNFSSNSGECILHNNLERMESSIDFEIMRSEKTFDYIDSNLFLKKRTYIPTNDFPKKTNYSNNSLIFLVDRNVLRVASNENVFCSEIKNYLFGTENFDPGGVLKINEFRNYTLIDYNTFQQQVMFAMKT